MYAHLPGTKAGIEMLIKRLKVTNVLLTGKNKKNGDIAADSSFV
jgi:hypothetical protein